MSGAFDDIFSQAICELEDETPGAIPSISSGRIPFIISRIRRALQLNGDDVMFKRLPSGGWYAVKAVVRELAPEELAPGVEQGTMEGILLADDLAAAGYPIPLKKQDRILFRNEIFTLKHDVEFLRVLSTDITIKFKFKG